MLIRNLFASFNSNWVGFRFWLQQKRLWIITNETQINNSIITS
jgi:hypothetical protein